MAMFMSTPVSLNQDPQGYKATQYFANILRAYGYDGLRYPSAVGREDGHNIALFEPSVVKHQKSKLVSIRRVLVEYSDRDGPLT
jgi:hypothetical protein